MHSAGCAQSAGSLRGFPTGPSDTGDTLLWRSLWVGRKLLDLKWSSAAGRGCLRGPAAWAEACLCCARSTQWEVHAPVEGGMLHLLGLTT